ncbi:hypothetical protein L6164_014295 [Bauhinia variegata]|uniref:Uncharacterized protein n=1 Tax=Bauhinia variegata TaxID=167791 RepID=A0ACB9NGT6_BAUVA|nr:hypothetical protein L6164_014295 [Bauhinia variegata]
MSYSEARAVSLCKRKGKESEMVETHHQFSLSSHHTGKKNTQEERNRPKRYPLLSFRELPGYMKDNEFILHYYRANWPLKQAFVSIFSWHNETLNVWTHLMGFFIFLGLTLANLMQPQVADLLGLFTRSLSSSADKNVSRNFKDLFLGTKILTDLTYQTPLKMELQSLDNQTPRWPFFVYLGGSIFCLLSSSICHLFSCHSHDLNLFLLRIDYVGITVMIITSFFPQIYYIFLCEPHWQWIYLGGITAMGLFTIATLLSPALSTNKYRTFRASLFCSMGLFGIIPAIHASFVNWGNPRRNVTLGYESAMALSYLSGTFFYVTRIPERWKPGWFDLAGHSHQIFHALVVVGALAHYAATLVMLEWRDTFGCASLQ